MAPQSYYLGGKIRASDFNIFAGDINDIVGIGSGDSGYGQDHLVVTQAIAGNSITAALWDELLSSINYAAQHQGTSINVPSSSSDAAWPAPGNVVSILPTLETDIANIVANKLNSDISYMTVVSNTISASETYVDPNNGTPNWTNANQVYYEVRITFASEDSRRQFFNAGGEIRFDSTLSNVGSDAQSLDWQSVLNAIATVKLSLTATESSASVGTPGVGFNQLTSTYQNVYTKGGTGDYSANQLNINAKLTGTDAIDVKISFDDAHAADTGTWSNNGGGSWTGTDYVAGTLTVEVGELVADDSPDGVEMTDATNSDWTRTYTTLSTLS